jgi:hypothetical protein
LQSYLSVYEDARENLRPITDNVARGGSIDGELGPIVLMVANHGQSQFFINFVCAAKSRGLDISRILLFATDQETYHLAESTIKHRFLLRPSQFRRGLGHDLGNNAGTKSVF